MPSLTTDGWMLNMLQMGIKCNNDLIFAQLGLLFTDPSLSIISAYARDDPCVLKTLVEMDDAIQVITNEKGLMRVMVFHTSKTDPSGHFSIISILLSPGQSLEYFNVVLTMGEAYCAIFGATGADLAIKKVVDAFIASNPLPRETLEGIIRYVLIEYGKDILKLTACTCPSYNS